MRIGIDASRANQAERTGTEWYSFHVIEELKGLIPDEHEVVLYSKEPLRDELADLPANWTSRVLGWPPRLLWTQLRLSWEMLWHKPDVIYIPAHTIPLVHPRRVVLVVHDVGFAKENELYDPKQIGYQSGLSARLLNGLVRLFTVGKYGASEQDYHLFSMRVAEKAATVVMTVSEFSKQEIADNYDISSERIVVAHNALHDRSESGGERSDVLERFKLEEPFVFYLGRLEEKKNIPRLIEAWALIQTRRPEVKLVLGGSPGFGHSRVEELIAKHGLESSVVQTGWLADADAAVLFEAAELFVLPSLYEGFGIPVLEAMSAGTPVACSQIPALVEVAGKAAVYFNPTSAEDISATILNLLGDEPLKRELIAAGLGRIGNFSWKKTAEATWKAISSVQ